MEENTLSFWWSAAGSLIKHGAYGVFPGQNAMWINQRHTTMSPLAKSTGGMDYRKHSLEARIAELQTPYIFPLILALHRLTVCSVLEGQSGHFIQGSSFLLSALRVST